MINKTVKIVMGLVVLCFLVPNLSAQETTILYDDRGEEPGVASEELQNEPFTIYDEEGKEIRITEGLSIGMESQSLIFRAAVVNPSICDIVQFTPKEVALIGKGQGVTNITFWFQDPTLKPHKYLVRVMPNQSANVQSSYASCQQRKARCRLWKRFRRR